VKRKVPFGKLRAGSWLVVSRFAPAPCAWDEGVKVIRIYALAVQFCTVRVLGRQREMNKLWLREAAKMPHEHWGLAIVYEQHAQFSHHRAVDGLHLIEE